MLARSVTAFAALGFLGAGLASPALAQSVDPALVLAAKGPAAKGFTAKGHAKPGQGFADRTARLTSIMGADTSGVAPLHLPTKPVWARPTRREADATASLR